MLDPLIERRNREAVMGLGEHLDELRRRLIFALTGVLPILIIALVFSKKLMEIMLIPVYAALRNAGLDARLQVTDALEMFTAWFQVALIATVVVGAPWLIYQLWLFIAPGLYTHERRFAYFLAPMSTLLTIVGVLIMYFGMLPLGLAFLIHFSADFKREPIPTKPLPAGVHLPEIAILDADPPDPLPGQEWFNTTLSERRTCVANDHAGHADIRGTALTAHAAVLQQYRVKPCIDFVLALALAFAIAFQLPVVILLLGWIGIVTPQSLAGYRRHALVGAVVVGALVAPTGDPLSLALLQVPLYLLFEFGLLLLRWLPASRVRGDRRDAQPGGMAEGP